MYVLDMREYQAHQRKIVRHFAPHMSNVALATQERSYFALAVARVLLVFLVPATAMLLVHGSFMKTPAFVLLTLLCVVEICLALYRYLVLWPEGKRMRWNYWHEIELAEDLYRLKIMGYYHRKIEKFIGRFPASMPAISIWQHYRMRDALVVTIFATGYVASLALLLLNRGKKEAWTWLLYLLSVASGLVVLRITKVHLIELPQVLALREHPEFATDLEPIPSEAIPFARPVASYNSTSSTVAPAVRVEPTMSKTVV